MTRAGSLSMVAVAVVFLLGCQGGGEVTPTSAPYDRDLFGRWDDADGDCRNTRHELLAELSTAPVRTTDDGCRILRGRWNDPYTGRIETDAGDLDVDHIVPLAWAWDHGADRWSRARRERFANDPVNLVPTDRGVNRSKGADGPDEWLPPDAEGRCGYVLRFLRIARSYELTIDEAEARRIETVRGRVCA